MAQRVRGIQGHARVASLNKVFLHHDTRQGGGVGPEFAAGVDRGVDARVDLVADVQS